jgi:hypothetical protein
MIHYQLRCHQGHAFDGWFKDSAGFEQQVAAGFVECPSCGATRVERALMAPAIPKKGRPARRPSPEPAPSPSPDLAAPEPAGKAVAGAPVPAEVLALLQRMRAEVERRCDYVGKDFAEQARQIHRGEREAKPIYGEASETEAEALKEEGIEVARIPWVPRADG